MLGCLVNTKKKTTGEICAPTKAKVWQICVNKRPFGAQPCFHIYVNIHFRCMAVDTWDSKSQKIVLSFDSTIEFRLEVLKHCSEHMGVQFHDRCHIYYQK